MKLPVVGWGLFLMGGALGALCFDQRHFACCEQMLLQVLSLVIITLRTSAHHQRYTALPVESSS
jgi:hypothetical protein